MSKARKLEVVAVALAVLCLALFVIATYYVFFVRIGKYYIGCDAGCLTVDHRPVPVLPMTYFQSSSNEIQWTDAAVSNGGGWIVAIPLWAPFVLCLVVAALAHLRARKPAPGACRKCGYDLTENVTGRCPECGT